MTKLDAALQALTTHTSPNAIFLLQETDNWTNFNDHTTLNTHVYHAHPNSNSAILIPKKMAGAVQQRGHGEDWSGIKTDKYIFLSIHANGITLNDDDDERCTYPDATLPEFLQFISSSNETFKAVVGIEANTTLLPNIQNITGKFTLPHYQHTTQPPAPAS